MGVAPKGALDPGTVRIFVRMVHDAAARALEGAVDPGMLQLDFLHPNGTGEMHSARFPIGAVDAMADSAISAASNGLNVFVEGRTVDVRKGRGTAKDTRGVFGFVNDSDGDKGKAGALSITPTWSIESSPGNRHDWILLDRALTPAEAEPLGRALRAGIGSDSATAKLTQPYRVAGTPNYPDAKKLARGRVVSPTRILSDCGPIWTADALARVFPPAPEKPTSDVPGGRSGRTSDTVEAMAADIGADRSKQFFHTIKAAIRADMLPEDVESVFRQHANGCGGKYLKPVDRLAAEIIRAWPKARAKVDEEDARPKVDPTYPDRAVPVDEARAAVSAIIEAHFAAGVGHRAVRVATGLGKTRAAAKAIAADVRRRREAGNGSAALYLVPTHRLGDEVAALFHTERVTARVFRGRGADDPDAEGSRMCLDMEAVDLAIKLHLTVSKACCKAKHPETGTIHYCPLFSACGYQRQIGDTPDVWIGAHDLLFSAPSGLGEIGSVTIDEGFWQTGLRIATRGIKLDDVGTEPGTGRNAFEMMEAADIAAWRSALRTALRSQDGLGGVERRHLADAGLDAALCGKANGAEWRLTDRIAIFPGMSKATRAAAARAAEYTSRVGRMSAVWRGAKDLLEAEEGAVSGRLTLIDKDAEDGFGKTRAVLTHGIRKVLQRWLELPVLMLDATLPDIAILRQFFPDVEVVADIEARMAHARVRQVLGAPVSAGKLLRSQAGRNREAIRRPILLRFVEAGRCSTLVIAQKDVAEWLRTSGLPAGISTAHYGAISGLDVYKDVGLLIAIGRTMPSVIEAETYAGALTGLSPTKTAEPAKGPRWFDRATQGLRLGDGAGHAVQGERHPDATVEAVRWQIAEAGVLQAIGRARAVNRAATNPVIIEIWNDLALPVTVDEAVQWEAVPSGYEADMVADGIVLESPSDMARCWPKVWETEKAARQWRDRTTMSQTLITATRSQNPIEDTLYKGLGPCAFRYRHPGVRQKWRQGWHEPGVCLEPRTWLKARLGMLAEFEYQPWGSATEHRERKCARL